MENSPQKRPSVWRRKYVVNFKFQAAFIRKSLFIAGLILGVQWFALQYIFLRFNIYADSLSYDSSKLFYDFLNDQSMMLNQTFLWMCLFTPICIFLWGVFQSHRIAGPLHNLKIKLHKIRQMKDVSDMSSIEETQFRRSDYFHELADEYNKTINHLKDVLDIQKQNISATNSNLVELKSFSKDNANNNKKDRAA